MSIVRPRYRFLLGLICLLYLLLTSWIAFYLPIFASPNEALHYEVVALLSQTGQLPDPATSWRADERHQAPLYYLLVGAASLPFRGLAPLDTELPGNPHFGSTHTGNLNPKIHAEWQNVPLLYIGRLVSMLFGIVGILGVSLATTVFRAPAIRLLAVSLFAFHPMVLFLGASLSNDLPVAAMAALVLGYTTTLITRPRTWRAFFVWGILLAAALLTKASAIFLLLLLPFVCLAQWHHHRMWRPVVYALVAAIGALLLLWGLWIFYNIQRHLDPMGIERSVRLTKFFILRPEDVPLLLPYLGRFWRSFTMDWSVGGVGFGPPPVYWSVAAGVITGLLGWIWVKPRGLDRLLAAMHMTWITAVLIFYLASTLLIARVHGVAFAEGRLLVLILPSLAWLTVGGWVGWWPMRWPVHLRTALAWCMLAVWTLTASLLVVRYLPWLYPRAVEVAAAAPSSTPSSLTVHPPLEYEGKLALIDFAIPERLTIGELTPVDLTWEAMAQPLRDYTISVQLLQPTTPHWVQLDMQNSYPGLGLNPTLGWEIGARYRDRFYLRPIGAMNGPTRAYAVVWVLDGDRDGDALTVVRGGEIQDPPIARIVVIDPATVLLVPERAKITPMEFDSQIQLIGLEQKTLEDGRIDLIAYWQAKQDIGEDYSLFVHYLKADGQIFAQADGEPNQNLSPTSLWRAGDVVRDAHLLPTGEVQGVRLGIYHKTTLERLPGYQEGQRLLDDAATVALEDIVADGD